MEHAVRPAHIPIAIKVLGWFLVVASALSVAQILLLSTFTFPHLAFNIALKAAALVAGYGFLRLKMWAIALYFLGVATAIIRMFVWPPSPEVGELFTTPSALGLTLLVPAIAGVVVATYWQRFARSVV
jgi:hypothetical protein